MINKIKDNKLNILALPVVIYSAVLLWRIIIAAVQTAPYANEYRESANIAMTRTILSGINPYSLSILNGEVPATCYLYGPLMSILAAAISIILPFISIQAIHYGISFISIVVSAFLIAFLVKKHSESYIAPSLAFMLTVFCHWRYGYIYGAPDSLGLLIIIAVLFSLSYKKPYLSAFLAVLSFFTKQYFIVIAITGAVYFLFVSKRIFAKYAAAGITLSACMALILNYTCPLFFTYAIYFLKGPGAGAAMGKTGTSYNQMQISYLGGMFLAIFIVATVAGISYLIGIFRYTSFSFELKTIDAPFLKFEIKNKPGNYVMADWDFILLFYIQLFFSGVLLRYIGRNAGAFISYYLQLFMPSLIVVACCMLDRIAKADVTGLLHIKNKAVKKWVAIIFAVAVYGIFTLYTIYKVEPRLVINYLSESELSSWEKAYSILDEYKDGEIYYMPILAYHAYENGKYVYNDGQPFVIGEKFVKSYNGSELAKRLAPHAGEVMKQHMDYRDEIRDKVRNGEYSLLMTMDDMDTVFTEEDMAEHYKKLDTVSLRAGSWAWDIDFWVLK